MGERTTRCEEKGIEPVTDRILIRGGILLTQDSELGEMAGADVLVEGDRIVEVGRNLSADGARVIGRVPVGGRRFDRG